MGREVAVLREGELVQTATPGVLYRTPADLDVARFVGEAVVLKGYARGAAVMCPLGHLEVLNPKLAGPVQVMIRPEQIRLARADRSGADELKGPDASAALAKVLTHSSYGPDTVVTAALGEGAGETIAARTFRTRPSRRR